MRDKALNLVIFEDDNAENFYPISVSHPVYDLLFGCFSVVDRLNSYFKPESLFLFCREYLAKLSHQRHNLPVNDFSKIKGDSILINAAVIPDIGVYEKLLAAEANTIYFSNDGCIGGRLSAKNIHDVSFNDIIRDPVRMPSGMQAKEIDVPLFKYLWDIVNFNCKAINFDIPLIPNIREWRRSPHTAKHGDDVYIHPGANFQAGANIDISNGPVVIDEGAKVEPRSLIQGPAYIGKNSVVMGGLIREGCSLGPVCKIGGELEESIILGYSNKCHEGFIGHAYIGEWVNLGALTTNSDLKNNYGTIKVSLNGKEVNTESIKVGSFIGDHTKTGIGTLLNTGIVIGFSNNLYGGALFSDKEIGHFKWGTPGNLVEFRLDKARDVAKAAMNRRGREFDDNQQSLFDIISRM